MPCLPAGRSNQAELRAQDVLLYQFFCVTIKRMIILGIDPGTAKTGFGVIQCSQKKVKLLKMGMIETSKEMAAPQRLNIIYRQSLQVLRENQPGFLAIESLFFNLNAKSASAVGQAIGVVKLAAARKKVSVVEYPPLRIKMVLTGHGRAKKKEIQSRVRKILKLHRLPKPSHVADALAVAICHWRTLNGKIKPGRG